MLKNIKHFLISLTLILWLSGITLWSVLAIVFGDSHSSPIQIAIASLVALSGLIAIATQIISTSWRRRQFWIHHIVFLIVVTWWFTIQPSNTRNWQTDLNKLAYASVNGDLVTVHNIRNFSYRSEFEYQPDYYDKTFDLNTLEGVDLIATYWMGPAIAHMFVSFDFGNNDYLTISIEARKENNEGYSTIKGFFRQYELVYIVADERDVIGLRTHYRHDPPEDVYVYRSHAPKESVKRLFLEYVANINALYNKPSFYNTLLSNCTTVIWLHSKVNPNHLPFSWKILLSGYLPEYIHESGGFDQSLSFSELKKQAYINPLVNGRDISTDYSTAIRSSHAQTK